MTDRRGITAVPAPLVRARIDALLAERWRHRYLTVVAGAGFGKSTALALATLDHSAPGVDTIVRLTSACSAADALEPLLDSALAELAKVPTGQRRCLILDDVHLIDSGSTGAEVLQETIRRLDPEVHVVFAGRTPPPLPLARARAAGHVSDVREGDLQFTDDELSDFARQQGVDIDTLADSGGWPALAALNARAGRRGAMEFLAEEVLAELDAKYVDALACAVLAGSADADLLRTVTGFEADVFDIAARVPMVAITDDGEVTPHALWQPLIERQLLGDQRSLMLRAIADVLRHRGDALGAVRVALSVGDTASLTEVVRDIGKIGHVAIRVDEIDRLLQRAPEQFSETPEGRLLRAVSARGRDPFSSDVKDMLRASWLEFRELGVIGCEVVAGSELAFVVRSRGEADEMLEVIARMIELHAQGHEEVRSIATFIRAAFAEQMGDVSGALAALDEIKAGDLSDAWLALVEFQRCNHLLLLGRPEEAAAAAHRSEAMALPGYIGGWCAVRSSSWHLGVTHDRLAQLPDATTIDSHSPIDRIWVGSWFGTLQAFAGRTAEAAHNIGEAAANLGRVTQPELQAFVVLAQTALAVAQGDEHRARGALGDFLEQYPLQTPLGSRTAQRFPALVDQLIDDDSKVALRQLPLGPWQREVLRASDALSAIRNGDASLEWPAAPMVLCALPLPWAVELAGLGARHGHPQAQQLADHIRAIAPDVRVDLTAPDDGHTNDAAGPVVLVALLGAVTVIGEQVAGLDELRRRRVRELLSVIALAGPISRERIMTVMWPDLDTDRASSNLRTNLSYLGRVRVGENTRIVQETETGWALAEGTACDAVLLERALRDGSDAERAGVPTVALEILASALAHARGVPLVDTSDDDWFAGHSDRLTMMLAGAASRAAHIALALGQHETAARLGQLAVTHDPYHEPAYRDLLAACSALGRHAEAAMLARALEIRLDELDVEPEPATQAVLDSLRGGGAGVRPIA